MSLTLESIRLVLREEVARALEKQAEQLSALGDGRRRWLTGAEVEARFGLGKDALSALRAGIKPRVRAKLGSGQGHGGKVWRYSIADLERELGVAS